MNLRAGEPSGKNIGGQECRNISWIRMTRPRILRSKQPSNNRSEFLYLICSNSTDQGCWRRDDFAERYSARLYIRRRSDASPVHVTGKAKHRTARINKRLETPHDSTVIAIIRQLIIADSAFNRPRGG